MFHEPRCLVCGAPLGKGAPFEKDIRDSEVCSDKCYDLYMNNEDENESGVAADAERYVHPQGYIKSVRVCGLCGEQL